jgi:predicted ATPase/DNA-binding CsgD family transcriptional regulator
VLGGDEGKEGLVAPSASDGPVLAPRTPLIGRTHELAALRDLILHADERLLTLAGVGGCGKTRLAIQLASDLAATFPRRVWLVELAPIADPALVPGVVVSALGLREEAGISSVEALAAFLAHQPALLILDNCEHLIDACAALADYLLTACPALRLLATSREPLQIAGERQYRVPPLATPDVDNLPGVNALARSPAVQLFVARAGAVAPAFSLTAENALLIARICVRLDGIPLALELAAARVRVLALEQILARLDDAFRLLVGGSRVAPTRQQTLRATLDWSDALLTEPERALFHRLAVFAGEYALEAVEAVCSDDDLPPAEILEVLTRLVDKSLVMVTDSDRSAWYRLLEPARQYALQHLTAHGETEMTRARHAMFFLALAERAAPMLRGPAQDVWLARLEREQGNLRAALRWAEEAGEGEIGLRLATALAPFWEAHVHLAEGRHWLLSALATPTDAVAPTLRMRALADAGHLSHLHAAYEEAERLQTESLTLARELGDRRGIAAALTELGMVARRRRDFARSIASIEEGLARYRELGDEAGIAEALLNLGATVGSQGDPTRAIPLLTDGQARFEALGDLRRIEIARALLASALLMRGDVEQATHSLAASLAAQAQRGDRWFVTYNLMVLVRVQIARERWEAAAHMLGAAEAIGAGVSSAISGNTYEELGRAIRAHLDAERFAAAWTAGHALSFEQAVAAALALAAPAAPEPKEPPPPPPGAAPLTRREREIARLLARGATNPQIAQALFITAGTVAWHVHSILQKLDLQSRHQVAAWLDAHPHPHGDHEQ